MEMIPMFSFFGNHVRLQMRTKKLPWPLFLYSRWTHYSRHKQKKDLVSLYTRMRELQSQWEERYFCTARYYGEVLVDARKLWKENLPYWLKNKQILKLNLHRYSHTLFVMCPRSRRVETSRRGRHWSWLWFRRGETSSRSGTSSSHRSRFSSKSHAHKLNVFPCKNQTTQLHFDNLRKMYILFKWNAL